MKKLFKFFTERHLLSYLITIMVFLIGFSQILLINKSQYPKVDLGEMRIITNYPGASPEDVELNVTNKIEEKLTGIAGIKEIVSYSRENLSSVSIELDDEATDLNEIKDDIKNEISKITDFPEDVTERPYIYENKTSLFPIIEVGIYGDVPYPELREYARRFEKKLKKISGVHSLRSYGYRDREIKIEVSHDKMEEKHISMDEIVKAIKARNIYSTGGEIESYVNEKNIVTLSEFDNPMEVKDVIVRSSFDGKVIKVRDLARIRDDFEEEKFKTRIERKNVISYEVTKSENADIIKTVKAIKRLTERQKSLLPDNVNFVFSGDGSKNVESKFTIVTSNGLIGLILVIIVLTIFLNFRTAFWVAMGIPFAVLGTIIVVSLMGLSLDTIMLTCLVLVIGIIVDDAIVISEIIYQRYEQGEKPIKAVVNGLREISLPVLTAVLTTFLAFAPMFFMKGMLGKFVFVIPFTIGLALFISLFEAFFIMPAHLLPGLRKSEVKHKTIIGKSWFNPVKNAFHKLLAGILKFRYLIIVLGILILGSTLFYAFKKMDFIMFPSKGSNRFYGSIELPIGSSLQATTDKVYEIEKILEDFSKREIESYAIRIGNGGRSYLTGKNYASVIVDLTPYSKRKRTADQIVEELRDKMNKLNGIRKFSFSVETDGPPTGRPVEIKIIGSDDIARNRLAGDVEGFVKRIEGVKDFERSDSHGKEQVELNINYEKLARLGLTVADIATNVRIAFDGHVVTNVRYGEENVNFRLIIEEKSRRKVDFIKKLLIPNNQDRLIELDEVIDLDIGPGTSLIEHYDGERSISIFADIDQDVTTSSKVKNQVYEKFNPVMLEKNYPGIRFYQGGEAEESDEAMIDLFITFGIAILAIYFLLLLLFNSLSQPLMIISLIPFGISGVIIAFALHDLPFSFLALNGVIGMAGVVINDALVLVNHINKLIKEKKDQSILKIVALATSERLRPIILTSITTIAGLLPLAYGLGGLDIYMAPMAMALGYGIFFATPVTLLLVPSLYVVGDDLKKLITLTSNKYGVKFVEKK